MTEQGSLDEGRQFYDLSVKLGRVVEAELKSEGLGVGEVAVLGALYNGPSYPTTLAAAIGRVPAQITRALTSLDEKGAIHYGRDRVDTRRRNVALTPDGRRIIEGFFEGLGKRVKELEENGELGNYQDGK